MAITTERYQGTLTDVAVAVLTAGVGDVLTISKAVITNTSTTTSYTFTVHDDVAGSGATTGNMCQNVVAISPKESKTLPLSALAAMKGGKVWMLASVTNVLNYSISVSRTTQ